MIVRLRSMGDCVLTTPAIEILKNTRPDIQIGVVVEDRFRAIFEGNSALTAILDPSFATVVRWHPSLCLNFHGGTRSMLLTGASGAKTRAGFGHHRGAGLYDVRIPRAQEIFEDDRPVHTAEHLASAMFFLGCPMQEIPRARLFTSPPKQSRLYAVFHPIAAAEYKTWRADRFVQVAKHVRRAMDLDPVFIGSNTDDLSPFQSFRTVKGAPLADIKSLIAGASLFFGNDSGPAHVAAAFDVPLAVVFARMDHAVTWAPWRSSAATSLVDTRGMCGISAADAIAKIEHLSIARR